MGVLAWILVIAGSIWITFGHVMTSSSSGWTLFFIFSVYYRRTPHSLLFMPDWLPDIPSIWAHCQQDPERISPRIYSFVPLARTLLSVTWVTPPIQRSLRE